MECFHISRPVLVIHLVHLLVHLLNWLDEMLDGLSPLWLIMSITKAASLALSPVPVTSLSTAEDDRWKTLINTDNSTAVNIFQDHLLPVPQVRSAEKEEADGDKKEKAYSPSIHTFSQSGLGFF